MLGRRVCRQGRKGGTRGQQLEAIALGQDTDDRGMADSAVEREKWSDATYILKLSWQNFLRD